jgi:RNA polymerase sigma-70 factor (ECF subfamily)
LDETRERSDRGPGNTEEDPSVSGLVTRSQQGDARSFERLYRLHAGMVYGICLRLVADPVRAEILTQDVFVRVWEKLRTYRGDGAFGGWVRRLAVNVVIDDRRSIARENQWLEYDTQGTGLEDTPGGGRSRAVPMGGMSATETAIDLERAVAALPNGARTAFVLHDVYGYRHREIAEMTGAASGTVKAQLHRARRLLRQSLGGSRG